MLSGHLLKHSGAHILGHSIAHPDFQEDAVRHVCGLGPKAWGTPQTMAPPHHPAKKADLHESREPVSKPHARHGVIVDLPSFCKEKGPTPQWIVGPHWVYKTLHGTHVYWPLFCDDEVGPGLINPCLFSSLKTNLRRAEAQHQRWNFPPRASRRKIAPLRGS